MAEGRNEIGKTPLLEWVFGAIGLVLFVGALIVTITNGMGPDEPPRIVVKAGEAEASDGRYRLEFEALNEGDQTAALVQLKAALIEGTSVVEEHTVEIDFLPARASRRAGVFFNRDPAGLTVKIEAVSYQQP